MIVRKVDLINQGNKGIKVLLVGHRKVNDQVAAKRDHETTEHLPLPIPLRQKFYRLKYFFLTMIGVWRDDQWTELLLDDYSGFHEVENLLPEGIDDEKAEIMKKDIASRIMAADTSFKNTIIDGYELDEGTSIKIKGSYEAINGKPFAPSLKFSPQVSTLTP